MKMSDKNSHALDAERRVVSLRGQASLRSPPEPVKDLAQYEQDHEDTDDYRHRMIVNLAVFFFVVGLIGLGLWLANTMAEMRKGQDCVLSGRRGCTPVEVNGGRW